MMQVSPSLKFNLHLRLMLSKLWHPYITSYELFSDKWKLGVKLLSSTAPLLYSQLHRRSRRWDNEPWSLLWTMDPVQAILNEVSASVIAIVSIRLYLENYIALLQYMNWASVMHVKFIAKNIMSIHPSADQKECLSPSYLWLLLDESFHLYLFAVWCSIVSILPSLASIFRDDAEHTIYVGVISSPF